jgi:hypothetical protein
MGENTLFYGEEFRSEGCRIGLFGVSATRGVGECTHDA